MRILVISNLYPPHVVGGYEMGCRQAVEALRSHGHDLRVLTATTHTPVPPVPHVHRVMKLANIYQQAFYHRCTDVVRRLMAADASFVSLHNVVTLIDELQSFQPDVVYLWHLVGLGGLGILGCLHHLRIPWVWHLMDSVPLSLCITVGGVVPGLAQEFNRQVSGSYLACSSRVINENEQGGVALKGEVTILPNWIVGQRPNRVRSTWYGGPTQAVKASRPLRMVSAAGWLGNHKGIDLAIHAAAGLRDAGIDNFSLDLYGKTVDRNYQALMQRLSVGRFVTLRGMREQSELARLYQDYDVFLFPTWEREPFGFAPLEAAAQGCVPLITDDCGLAEWLVHGVHCLKAGRTAPALVKSIQSILDGVIDLRLLGQRAQRVVWRDFHIEAVVPRIEAALLRASRKSRAGAGTVAEVHRMAAVAEKLSHLLIQESCAA
jgi:glycosyltransferase involved in cell wall biosynthesis